MSGKKLINSVEGAVDEALEGLTLLHPGLNKIQGHRVILREKVGTFSPNPTGKGGGQYSM